MTTTWRSWPTKQKLAVALAAAVFALALIGLRGEIAAAGDTARASRASSVAIDRFAYHPPMLTIAVGSRVTFSNASDVTHTATRAGGFSTGRIKPGRSVSIRFASKGTFAYHCTIHPFMHGKIVVR